MFVYWLNLCSFYWFTNTQVSMGNRFNIDQLSKTIIDNSIIDCNSNYWNKVLQLPTGAAISGGDSAKNPKWLPHLPVIGFYFPIFCCPATIIIAYYAGSFLLCSGGKPASPISALHFKRFATRHLKFHPHNVARRRHLLKKICTQVGNIELFNVVEWCR